LLRISVRDVVPFDADGRREADRRRLVGAQAPDLAVGDEGAPDLAALDAGAVIVDDDVGDADGRLDRGRGARLRQTDLGADGQGGQAQQGREED
jgi:hypothetical protein